MGKGAKKPPLTLQWQIEKYCWAISLAIVCYYAYNWVGEYTMHRQTAYGFPWDEWVPFLPWTVWCYLPFYVLIFHVGTFSIRERGVYFRTILGIAVAFIGCSIFFLAAPSSYPRLELPDGTDPLNAMFLEWVRKIDVPNNTFPSSHVALSFACAFGTLRDNRRWGTVGMVMAACLSVSILTTKQHYVVDSIGGIVMGYIAYRFAFWAGASEAPEPAT